MTTGPGEVAAPDLDRNPVPPSDDAVVPDPDASYERAGGAPPVTDRERAIVSAQLGRPARGESAVVHRCVFGLPTAVRVAPRLDDGTPFPTVFWQTCPALRSQIGRLEAAHEMVTINEQLDADEGFQSAHAAATQRYVAFRDELAGGEKLPGDPRAGGNERYVKCLHVHAAHFLATNDGPVGERTMELARPVPCSGPCVSEEDVATWTARP
ncbi:MAG: DUF501 domain-containing protein [Actinobacteria bacterium]|nr:DUF501 domain-containing protein [Actinomycetota bacterium]